VLSISINGRIANKKAIYAFTDAVCYNLMPRIKRNVSINIQVVTRCDKEHSALCWGDRECAEIEIARRSFDTVFTLEEMIVNLAHELVHAKQFIKGELHPNLHKWKKVDYSNTPYDKQPWEKEAYLLEQELYKKYWKTNGKISTKKSKQVTN